MPFSSSFLPSNSDHNRVDAEKLTSEEAMSRLLHNPRPKVKLARVSAPIYDQFFVVGLDSVDGDCPKVLYSYPSGDRWVEWK